MSRALPSTTVAPLNDRRYYRKTKVITVRPRTSSIDCSNRSNPPQRGGGSRPRGRSRRYRHIGTIAAAAALTTACQTTSIPGLHVRAQPSTASPVVATVERSGTYVRIDCFVRGESVSGDTVWYRISSPHDGYVTNYYIRTNGNILATKPRC